MEYIGPFVFGFLLLIVACVVVGLCGGILYLIYLPIRNRLIRKNKLTSETSKLINRIYILILFLFSAHTTFDAFFPSEGFYEGEFKTVTLRDLPKSATFVAKSASYPYVQGEYCSSSQIKLSKEEYQKLLKELQSDGRMKYKRELVGSQEFNDVLRNKTYDKITVSFTRPVKGEEDRCYSISFYDDQQTIFVNICVT
jgi:hypothetical protein